MNVLVWQDPHRAHVPGALIEDKATDLADSSLYTPGAEHQVRTEAGHRLTVSGYLDTSHGRVTTTVTRTLANSSVHRWTDGETTDGLDATWTDDETVRTAGHGPARTTHTHRTYTVNGAVTLGSDARLRTVLTLGDRASSVVREGRPAHRVVAAGRHLQRRRRVHDRRSARPAARGRHVDRALPAPRLGRLLRPFP